MSTTLLKSLSLVFLLAACNRQMHRQKETVNSNIDQPAISEQPVIASDKTPASLMDLPQTQDAGFVLSPGFYEAEFKPIACNPARLTHHREMRIYKAR